ncbi:MAG: sugar phosphate isomerase/epimerase family protein [Desulfovibrionaceae bacterium]
MDTPYFVNLPCSYIERTPDYLPFFIGHRIPPELGLDAACLETCDAAWHRATAAAFRDAGLPCAVHLAFLDLHPGSGDPIILAATRARLHACFDAARHYAPRHLIGHPHYDEAYADQPEAWRERCRTTWAMLLDRWPDHPPLYLENTFDADPEPLRDLVDALRATGHDRVGVCFDAGHWHAFAKGSERRDLDRWLDALGNLVGHLHLHDNDGGEDQHLGLGQGSIPWAALARGLAARGVRPTATLEPHTEASFAHSMAFITAHPELFADIRTAMPA